ncbi:MAG: glycosyltransferase family 2 protein [Suipraeoptans sp.]
MELISIIVPVYNVEKYLNECLDSLIMQSYKTIEILLIDDGSSDSSGKICEDYARNDNRIKVIHTKNGGQARARNLGLSILNGEWVLFVDSDDWIDRKLVEKCVKELRRTDDFCIFGIKKIEKECDHFVDNESVITLSEVDFIDFQKEIFNRDRKTKFDNNTIKAGSVAKMYRTSFLKKHNIVFPEEIANGEDMIFNLYVFRYARSARCIENVLYFYRQREGSVTHTYMGNAREEFIKLNNQYDFFVSTEKKPEEWIEMLHERKVLSLAFCCIFDYCNKDNYQRYRKRKKDFLYTTNSDYSKTLDQVNLSNFGLKKRILFFLIKHRCFFGVNFFCSRYL